MQGTKTVEWLIRPERPGKTTIPALTFASFDPATKTYVETQSKPIELQVSGERSEHDDRTADGGGGGRRRRAARTSSPRRSGRSACARRRRVRSGRRSCMAPAFKVTLVTPPLAFVAVAFVGRLRQRLSRDERAHQPAPAAIDRAPPPARRGRPSRGGPRAGVLRRDRTGAARRAVREAARARRWRCASTSWPICSRRADCRPRTSGACAACWRRATRRGSRRRRAGRQAGAGRDARTRGGADRRASRRRRSRSGGGASA